MKHLKISFLAILSCLMILGLVSCNDGNGNENPVNQDLSNLLETLETKKATIIMDDYSDVGQEKIASFFDEEENSLKSMSPVELNSYTFTEFDSKINGVKKPIETRTQDLFISEYWDISFRNGVSTTDNDNKGLELYNPLDQSIDLSQYKVVYYSNGSETEKGHLDFTGSLESKKTYVICNQYGDDEFLSHAQKTCELFIGPKSYIELRKNDVIIDTFGVFGRSYDTNADNFIINGVHGATKTKKVLRKPGFAANSEFYQKEWEVSEDEDTSSLGFHKYLETNVPPVEENDAQKIAAAVQYIQDSFNDHNFDGNIPLIHSYNGITITYSSWTQTDYDDEGKLVASEATFAGFTFSLSLNGVNYQNENEYYIMVNYTE